VKVDSRSFNGAFAGSCGGYGGEQLFSLTLEAPSEVTLTTDLSGTAAGTDTVLYIRRVCEDEGSELAGTCNDDVSADPASRNFASRTTAVLEPGAYVVFADSYLAGGIFELLATVTPL
jgi:hypothetical protein